VSLAFNHHLFNKTHMKNRLLTAEPIWADQALGIVRIVVGIFMIYHGWEVFDKAKMEEYAAWDTFKNYPSATFMVYLGKAAELAGGILLTIGFLTRIASIVLAGTMAYITFFVGNGIVWYNDQHPFMFVLLAIIFFFVGPGKWAIDKKRR
jgi:uncharacterized membrane protein YphA (DoxX/SURF4 family)